MPNPESRKTAMIAGHEFLIIIVISLAALALAIAISVFPLARRFEFGSRDLRLRMRYSLNNNHNAARPEITILALDNTTQDRLGMYRAGKWLVRKPYLDQLRFFEEYFRPSVIAYDLLFQDTIGSSTGAPSRVSESPEILDQIADAVQKVATRVNDVIPSATLCNLAGFAAEQGDIFLSQRFAAITESKAFPLITGFYFRGGWSDPKTMSIPPFSDGDIFSNDPDGREDNGARIPYLLDLAIPDSMITFPSETDRSAYKACVNATTPSPNLLDYALLGFINGNPDDDGVHRRMPLILGFTYLNRKTGVTRTAFVPSFGLMCVMRHLGITFPLAEAPPFPIEVRFGEKVILRPPAGPPYHIPIDAHGAYYLNYDAMIEDYQSFSFVEVTPSYQDTTDVQRDHLARTLAPRINGHIVLVAPVSAGLGDIGACPLSVRTPLIHTHATVINNILNRSFLAPLTRPRHVWLAILLFALYTTICLSRNIKAFASTAVLFTTLYLVSTYAGVHFNYALLPVTWPLLYMALGLFGVTVYRYLAAERARIKIRKFFSTMVSADVLAFLENNPDSFSLAGHSVEATIMMSDIVGFTTISEHLPPDRLTTLMNSYFTPVTDCIMQHGGYVDKYIGDGVMAVWGAPFANPRHALEGCLAALEQQALLRKLNQHMESEFGIRIQVRMGLNSGNVTAGNMGSAQRMQYTVMGDAVNLAKRLEAVNHDYGTFIVIGEQTCEQVRHVMAVRWLDTIKVKGRTEPAKVFELIGLRSDLDSIHSAAIEDYECAMTHYLDHKLTDAMRILEKSLARADDPPSRMLLQRIAGNSGTA